MGINETYFQRLTKYKQRHIKIILRKNQPKHYTLTKNWPGINMDNGRQQVGKDPIITLFQQYQLDHGPLEPLAILELE